MKIFHLADLHIGKNVNGFSMLDDQVYILEQIIHYIQVEKPDVIMIAGDVYDKATPGTEAVQVFDWFLTSLVHAKTAVMVVSGNHDSPERLAFANKIISDNRVYVCGVYDGNIHTVTLRDEFGEVIFYLLPFVKPSNVRRFFEDAPIDTYQEAVKAVIEATALDASKRNILVAHQFFVSSGHDMERCESEIGAVGGIDSIDARIVSGFDYVALGHLHKSQKSGYDFIRYAGSPLKYSGSECGHKKSIVMLELGEKGNLDMTTLPLTPFRDMRKMKGTLAQLTNKEIVSQVMEDYVHVTLTDDDEIVDAIGKMRSVYPYIMTLNFENSRTKAASDFGAYTEIDHTTPFELFEIFFAEQNGLAMKKQQIDIVHKLLEQTGGNE